MARSTLKNSLRLWCKSLQLQALQTAILGNFHKIPCQPQALQNNAALPVACTIFIR